MKQRHLVLAILAIFAAASWLVFRVPDGGGGEKKGILKERLRAAESALQTLDAERAAGRERLRLAGKKADENRARSTRAAAALPFYEQRRKEASARWAESATEVSHLPGQRERRGDGEKQKMADDAALLRRLNALLR
ncbi:MAG: hypothetical protein HZA03_03935 [Nitrospinae bacterium]|nr:hypothetical protein [Nitrospinota bacterium]